MHPLNSYSTQPSVNQPSPVNSNQLFSSNSFNKIDQGKGYSLKNDADQTRPNLNQGPTKTNQRTANGGHHQFFANNRQESSLVNTNLSKGSYPANNTQPTQNASVQLFANVRLNGFNSAYNSQTSQKDQTSKNEGNLKSQTKLLPQGATFTQNTVEKNNQFTENPSAIQRAIQDPSWPDRHMQDYMSSNSLQRPNSQFDQNSYNSGINHSSGPNWDSSAQNAGLNQANYIPQPQLNADSHPSNGNHIYEHGYFPYVNSVQAFQNQPSPYDTGAQLQFYDNNYSYFNMQMYYNPYSQFQPYAYDPQAYGLVSNIPDGGYGYGLSPFFCSLQQNQTPALKLNCVELQDYCSEPQNNSTDEQNLASEENKNRPDLQSQALEPQENKQSPLESDKANDSEERVSYCLESNGLCMPDEFNPFSRLEARMKYSVSERDKIISEKFIKRLKMEQMLKNLYPRKLFKKAPPPKVKEPEEAEAEEKK